MALFLKSPRRQIMELPIASISPNPHQPRKVFRDEELSELARSIAQLGILQPLSVRRVSTGWELIAGERRLRAAQLAGLTTVPCLVVDADPDTSALLALVENIQRKDLSVWEEAQALKQLIDQFHLSQEEAAQRVGKSQSAVANKLRLLKLPADVISSLQQAQLTERHARALLRLESADQQRTAAQHIIRNHLNVAQTEHYVDKLCQKPSSRKAIPIYRTRDVRLFLNTVQHGLALMQSSGVDAHCGREETEHEITLTIRIAK